MKIHHEVISIHPERKTVSVKNLENGEIFEEKYDKLILSPGAKPTQPRLPGVGMDKLFTLRTVEGTFRIKEYINKNHPKSAVLAGGGFIGLELAENLRELGMDVTIVQRPKQLMNPFDPDMASMIHNEMRKHGIKLVLGYTVEGFKEKDNGVEVLLKDNPSLQADMVVLAIGVTPDTVLAKEAGLELGIKESIVVNDRMETSVPDIYAAGDAVQVKHYVTGNDALISLAGPANKQGRIIADNICGGDSRYLGSQGSSVIKVFDMTAATTGINETNAKKSGLEVDTVILSPMSHDCLVQRCRLGEQQQLDEIVALIVETISIERENITISGVKYPYQFVKSRLLLLEESHIEYVLDCLHENTREVKNIKAYLLTCLMNSITTIGNYYQAKVNHDMYGGGI